MNLDEIYDVIDEQDRVIGKAKRREVHADPSLIHRAVCILVFRGKTLYLQKRSATKDHYPNAWTCSASGHVDSGETYEIAAVRELEEEIGIKATKPLEKIDEKVFEYPWETERTRFFRYDDETTLIQNDPEEIADGKFIPLTKESLDSITLEAGYTPCIVHMAQTYLRRCM